MEATSTRRAGLERFTFPGSTRTPFFTLDLANDLPRSFKGGNMTIDPETGRITIGGFWGSRYVTKNSTYANLFKADDYETGSFGPGSFKYQAFACYDLNNGAQKRDQFGVWTADSSVCSSSCFRMVNQSLDTQERPRRTRTWGDAAQTPG